ncbi:MAG: type II toxin-antitoxin system VapC family toxin [Candidatus Asgardarchaeum sp.]
MKIVLDSSIIAALFFKDPFSEAAEKSLKRYDEYYTVDFAAVEIANVAWKRVTLFNESRKIIEEALDDAINFIETLCCVVSSYKIYRNAFNIGIATKIPIYDALFLALANILNSKLLTCDTKLKNSLRKTKYFKLLEYPT